MHCASLNMFEDPRTETDWQDNNERCNHEKEVLASRREEGESSLLLKIFFITLRLPSCFFFFYFWTNNFQRVIVCERLQLSPTSKYQVWQTDGGMSSVMDWTEENTLKLPGFGFFPETVIELLENLTKVFIKALLSSVVGCLPNWRYWSEYIYFLCLSKRRRISYVKMPSQ